jgi:hypothetical protein
VEKALAVAIWHMVVASSGTAMAELELAAAIHGGSGHGGVLKRGRERRRRASNGEHGASRSGSVSMTREEVAGHVARRWGMELGLVATQRRTCRSFTHCLEHVVCVNQSDLEAMFGPAMGRTGLWA